MTIEDLIQIHDDRIERLNRFLRLVHLGTRSKENALARKARRRLIGEIGFMLDYEQDALDAELEYLYSTTPAQRELDERAAPGRCDNDDFFEVDFAVVHLLEGQLFIDNDGRILESVTGKWRRPEPGFPKMITTTPDELGDLAALIAMMEQELGITFTFDRYFWSESELEQCG